MCFLASAASLPFTCGHEKRRRLAIFQYRPTTALNNKWKSLRRMGAQFLVIEIALFLRVEVVVRTGKLSK